MQTNENKAPPWKMPIMWLVVGLPLASVVAGILLVVVATRSGGTDVVRDEVQRVSQVQTTDLGADEQARALELSAVLRADDGVLEVIPATGRFPRSAPLRLVLQHPTTTGADVELELAPTATGWRSEQVLDDSHDWVVQLSAADGSWRLHGRLPKRQHATRLAPSLAR